MSAETPRPTLLKVGGHPWVDRWRDWLVEAGYQVLRARDFQEALLLARRAQPRLILIVDDPKNHLDAIEWLELQHIDSDPLLPMLPLLIVTGRQGGAEARLQELPDRVQVLERPLDPEALIEKVRAMINAWW
ncbi:MAG: hypothetical protein HC915_12700 [Anaerolineae bacterium]|nr:hypothetical protein [Anaerolineae bacterium]